MDSDNPTGRDDAETSTQTDPHAGSVGFRDEVLMVEGAGAYAIFVSDVDGDPGAELVLLEPERFDLIRWTPTGAQVLYSTPTNTSGPRLRPGSEVHFGDIDGDGDRDVAVTCFECGVLTLLNEGNASLGPLTTQDIPPTTNLLPATTVAVRDGPQMGLFVGEIGLFPKLWVWSAGQWETDGTSSELPGCGAVDFATADIDNDADEDIVFVRLPCSPPWDDTKAVGVLLQEGDGAFASGAQFLDGDPAFSANEVVVGEFTGDDAQDVIIARTWADDEFDELVLLPGNGAGDLGEPTVVRAVGISKLQAADLDDDGVDEVYGIRDGVLYRVNHLGDDATATSLADVSSDHHPYDIGDLDGDGRLDIVYIGPEQWGDRSVVALLQEEPR